MTATLDLSQLASLTLESCPTLETTFLLVSDPESAYYSKIKDWNLHSLTIRYEQANDDFLQSLEDFLNALKPLTNLQLLLESVTSRVIGPEPVQNHGNKLQSLVWDDRKRSRHSTMEQTHFGDEDLSVWQLVSEACPIPGSLGLSLDWEAFLEDENVRRFQEVN